MSFRFVPNSVTLNDLERRNGPYIAYYFIESTRLRLYTYLSTTQSRDTMYNFSTEHRFHLKLLRAYLP